MLTSVALLTALFSAQASIPRDAASFPIAHHVSFVMDECIGGLEADVRQGDGAVMPVCFRPRVQVFRFHMGHDLKPTRRML
jgi:hypothetical protein